MNADYSIILYIDDKRCYQRISEQIAQNNTHLNSTTSILRQITKSVPTWVLMVETPTLETSILRIAEMVYAITGNLQLVLPEENSLLIGQKDFTDIATNRYFHPLLPGVVVRIPTFQKQLVLQLCKNMRGSAHFKHCLLAIQHMQAPNWSGDIPFASVEITPADDLGPKLSSTTDNNTGTVRRFKMVLPRRAVTYLIGKNGHKIEQLRTQTRATIKIRDPQPSSSSSSAASHQRNFTGSSFLQEIVITADDEDELNYARSLIEEQIKLWLC